MMESNTPLAVVGYAYRAPGVGRKGLWDFLADAKSAWSEVPADRFIKDAFHHAGDKPGFFPSEGGHFLPDDVYAFDASFFNIKTEEARSLDPQTRLILECAFEAAESAGLTLPGMAGANIGVFAQATFSDYSMRLVEDLQTTNKYAGLGISQSLVANRLSYFFGLTGPSVAVDAACAGTTYALHQACQSLRSGECSAALVAAGSIISGPEMWVALASIGALSPEGKSFAYDSRAAGFGRGEGGGCLIIKPLADAIACGDPVRAVIRGTACNHSGRTKGITMPSQPAQESLLTKLHDNAKLDPRETIFVEGHGTGTKAGDPIDAGAIAAVVAKEASAEHPTYIGSAKSNFGHLEGASGMVSVIKAMMMLEQECMLPNANFEKLNPDIVNDGRLKVTFLQASIDYTESVAEQRGDGQVLTRPLPWPSDAKRRICVTNFGFGGSNAAVLLERAPQAQTYGIHNPMVNGVSHQVGRVISDGDTNSDHALSNTVSPSRNTKDKLFVLSAKSATSLEAYVSSLAGYLEHRSTSSQFKFLLDLSYTLSHRRTHFPRHRLAVSADSLTSLLDQLRSVRLNTISAESLDGNIAFIFTGQGAQYFRMASGLEQYGAFSNAIKQADSFLGELGAPWSLTEELARSQGESRVNDAEISQPACTVIQLGLIVLLQSWGISPVAVVGHSSGEIAAAFAAKLISFEAAIAISYFRGVAVNNIILDGLEQGAMLAVGSSAEETTKLIEEEEGYTTIAAINSHNSVTISGDIDAIENIQERCKERDIFARRLKVNIAYHSRHMETAAASYLASIELFCLSSRESPERESSTKPAFISSVTGKQEHADTVAEGSYWVRNLVGTVQFLKALERLQSYDVSGEQKADTTGGRQLLAIEIGPHSALKNPTMQTMSILATKNGQVGSNVTYLPSLIRGTLAPVALLNLAGKLFVSGSDIKLNEVNQLDHVDTKVVHDLPPYEWNRSSRYIHQPRIATKKLFGGEAHSSLLGSKSPYGEGNEHVYRNVFTLDDLPWIRDHNVGGDVLFPFTGFFSLAIEAFKRVQQNATPVSNVLVREFHVSKGLRIKEDEQVDLTTKIRPADMGTEVASNAAWAFEVISWSSADGWTTHCRGLVERDHGEMFEQSPAVKAAARLLENPASQPMDVEAEYAVQRQNGLIYGTTFFNTVNMRRLPGAIIHTVQVRDIVAVATSPDMSGVAVDPPTLDSFLQTIGAIQELEGPRPVHVPTHTRRWRIFNRTSADAGRQFTIVTRKLSHDSKSGNLQLSYVVFDLSSGAPEPIMEIDNMALKAITQVNHESLAQGLPKTYFLRHVPHVDLADASVLAKNITPPAADASELQCRRDWNEVSVIFLNRMVESIPSHDVINLPSHLSKFLAWSQRLVDATQLSPGSSLADDEQALISRVTNSNAAGEMLCTVGAKLPQIIRGEVEPLEIMLEDSLLTRYYEQDPASKRSSEALAEYVGLFHECNPDIRILEIGGGTGSATLPVLEAMSRSSFAGAASSARFQYTFTDISAGFFENARAKLGRWSNHITYKKLDISLDPLEQGFFAEDYDLVIASNVLHATPDIVRTIRNTTVLLKPGGKLVLMELTKTSNPMAFPFASLPGWWLSEDDYRSADGPLMTKESWRALLEANGFPLGIDGFVDDYPGEPERFITTMWSTKQSQVGNSSGSFAICQVSGGENYDTTFVDLISQELQDASGVQTTVSPLLELELDNKPCCIFVDDPQHSQFSDPSSEMFSALQKAFTETAAHVLWVIPANSHPDSALIKGLLRTLRMEDDTKAFVILENATFDKTGLKAISQLARRLANPSILDEQEYSMVDEALYIPRFCSHEPADQTFAMEAGVSVKEEQSIWISTAHQEHGQALEMTVDAVGSPDSIYFRDNTETVFREPLSGDEVIIQVRAIGVNFRDLLLVLGSLPWHPPGFEGAGVVVRAGPDVMGLQVGDQVLYTVPKAGMTNYVRTSSSQVHELPDGLHMTDAASMPIAYCTALLSIVDTARLQKGESILIHAATGALGQACIMLAQHLGADVFATAGTPEKREFLTSTFGIPADHIFSSRTPEFRAGILLATDNRGIDVIVNSLSGSLLQQSWELIAPHGRFVELGKKDLLQNSHLAMRPFLQNASFHALDLRKIEGARPGAVKGWLAEMVRLYRSGTIRPIQPVTQVPISQMAAGLRRLQTGHNIGKVVLTLGPDEKVLAERSSPLTLPPTISSVRSTLLAPDATYLITGGTGGIGRALGEWMVKQGAKHIVLLGRSGSSNPKVADLLKKYEGTEVCIRAIAADVGYRGSLLQVKEEIKDLPPVRGVIHGALYLRDAMFVNSSFEDYQNITRPKMQAAWLLDELFPNLDFFVSLSSLDSIIGHFGQSIYSGSSTFLDAFSEHRLKQGKPAVSISLPVVEGVGYVADRGISERLKGSLGLSLGEDHLYTLVQGAILGPASGLNVDGRSFSFVTNPTEADAALPWEHFHFLRAIAPPRRGWGHSANGGANGAPLKATGKGADAKRGVDMSPEAVMEALRTKVSNVTMMERDDITPERSLIHYGLDSLVSVELRNWIRREYGADLTLKDIVAARHLNALSQDILAHIRYNGL